MMSKMGKPVMKKGMSMAKDGMKPPTPMANTSMGGMGMKKGGMPPALAKHAAMKASKAHAGLKSGGMTKMAKGGGIESKGKTKGMMVKMMGSGGKK